MCYGNLTSCAIYFHGVLFVVVYLAYFAVAFAMEIVSLEEWSIWKFYQRIELAVLRWIIRDILSCRVRNDVSLS